MNMLEINIGKIAGVAALHTQNKHCDFAFVMVLDRPAVGTCLRRVRKGLIPISCLPNTDLSSTFYR
jgi:hypothetical protein